MNRDARLDVIRELRERARQLNAATGEEADLAKRLTLLQLLRGDGWPPGTLVEWQGCEGGGAAALALAVAARVMRQGGALVVIDAAGEFYPPAAAAVGVPLERTIVVRPRDAPGVLWAWEQSLRSGAAAVTFGIADERMERHIHRLRLASEAGASLGFLLRPSGRAALKAQMRLRVTPRPSRGPLHSLARRLCVEILHCRGGTVGETAEVELDDETGDVRVVAELAGAAMAAGAAVG